jgi:hypothetical protein
LKEEPIWFFQFGKPTAVNHLQKWAQDYKFKKTLTPKIDRAIEDWKATQPIEVNLPKIIEYPIDKTVQTGESQLLGGAMEIKAPWLDS